MADNAKNMGEIQNEVEISRQATAWVIALREADDTQRKAFAAWLKLSPLHVEHYLRTKALVHSLLKLKPTTLSVR